MERQEFEIVVGSDKRSTTVGLSELLRLIRGGAKIYEIREAVHGPDDAAADVKEWVGEIASTFTIEQAVTALRRYPAEELAKHGVTLEPDDFEKAAQAAYRKFRLNVALGGRNHAEADYWRSHKETIETKDYKAFKIAANYLRTHCRPIGSDRNA